MFFWNCLIKVKRSFTHEAKAALVTATMPRAANDQGSVLLEEKDLKLTRQVACWFSKDQADQFSKIKGGQYITVKGIFNGEAGAELRFCRLVTIE